MPLSYEELSGELVVARSGCGRCHALPDDTAERLLPIHGPALAEAAGFHAADGGEAFLRRHHGGDAATDLAAWVRSFGTSTPLAAAVVVPADIDRGERLFRELACQACHAPTALEALAARTDHLHIATFLADPANHRPGVVHDFRLAREEASALAAWLLRSQDSSAATAEVPGFAWECFEVHIDDAGPPDLTGVPVAARGTAPRIEASVGTREDHFALRFQATLNVPATGEWTFTCGSDDSSWLWIDDRIVVENEGLAPHHKKHATLHLDAGLHTLRVLYTEAEGGQSLEVLWQGPGVSEQAIPADRATATSRALVPPQSLPAPDPAAVQRGRARARELRCDACHAILDPEWLAPPPLPARAFSALGAGSCPNAPGAAAIHAAASAGMAKPHDASASLTTALLRDGCLSCHIRDGRGGLRPAVRQGLTTVEDLGDEGRLPPDLTAVGRRLRPAWIEKVLREGHSVRPYLRVRMPRVPAERAAAYAAWFAAVDGPVGDDEPPFSVEAVQLGRQLAGTGGRNCVTCHPFDGRKALGPQGMDLAFQHERLRPAWFREWLLHPTTLRPGTRMPALWWQGDDADRREIDALRTWLSLGVGAPLPAGLVVAPRALLLEPADRPVLHGAFLQGLSARCVAVGSPLRTHYAYDVEHARLAWLWRGAFLDAEGTWSGRAGKLLVPKGQDWVVLEELGVSNEPDPPSGDSGYRAVLGRRLDADGYPIWRVLVGGAEFEDHVRPRLAVGGSEVVRTLHVKKGTLKIDIASMSGKARLEVTPANVRELEPGQSLEIVYRW